MIEMYDPEKKGNLNLQLQTAMEEFCREALKQKEMAAIFKEQVCNTKVPHLEIIKKETNLKKQREIALEKNKRLMTILTSYKEHMGE
jgi:hypothetical protein